MTAFRITIMSGMEMCMSTMCMRRCDHFSDVLSILPVPAPIKAAR